MALDVRECRFSGPALPEPFVRFDLERELGQLLPKASGDAGKALEASWEAYRRRLRDLVSQGGSLRVRNQVIEPLMEPLGYVQIADAENVVTREGSEAGGSLLVSPEMKLRVWTVPMGEDLDSPSKRGRAYRYSHVRVAQRVLLANNERVGLISNGYELRILISDPARSDSQIEIPIDSHWKKSREVPDSYRLLMALCCPKGIKAVPGLIEKARLKQTGVTKELRKQARRAIELFVQQIIDHPENRDKIAAITDKDALAKQLWREGLINIFRLLFVLKMESIDDQARAFSFISHSLWRNTYSPSMALAKVVRDVLDRGTPSGQYLEDGLRALYQMFTTGLSSTELNIKPLGGALFGPEATPLISGLHWGETAVAHLLDQLLWTTWERGAQARERVHYGPLTVGDLGRIYEALIELEPGITAEPMCRLRRSKLEVVVPVVQGERYKPKAAPVSDDPENGNDDEGEDEAETGKKTKIVWIEEIPAHRFYLRVGLGRKSSGAYYTPDSFVKFLVQETVGPLCAERSPKEDPQPGKLLELKVADIAMGSGHFLFEACDFLGEKLYEACRLCDELAMNAETQAEALPDGTDKAALIAKAQEFWKRVLDLPDPNDELMAYLPSRAPEDGTMGYSIKKAEALCKRLVAVHCLYGVDKNPLAVELAKLSLWIETHAEGLPLTFLDHRFMVGDSITGPFFEHLAKYPGSQQPMEDLFTQGLKERLTASLHDALREIKELDASIGISLAEMAAKKAAKIRIDHILEPYKYIAHAWAGGIMLGDAECDDDGYAVIADKVSKGEDPQSDIYSNDRLMKMVEIGRDSLPIDLSFPDVFLNTNRASGFDVILGNPPWNKSNVEMPEVMANYDLRFFEIETSKQRDELVAENKTTPIWDIWQNIAIEEMHLLNALKVLYPELFDDELGFGSGNIDIFASFISRLNHVLGMNRYSGMLVPSALHVSKSLRKLRIILLSSYKIQSYYCYENLKGLFDIHKSWKFTPLVLTRQSCPEDYAFPAQFYLHEEKWLFDAVKNPPTYAYPVSIISRMDKEYLVFQEFTSEDDLSCSDTIFTHSISWSKYCEDNKWDIRRELHATDDRWRINYTDNAHRIWKPELNGLIHHQPGTMHQYTDLWDGATTAFIPINNLRNKPAVLFLTSYYRACYRTSARATDERTSIYTMLPPGTTATNSLPIEGNPHKRSNSLSLGAIAVCNSFGFDWCLRLRVGSKTVSKFIMAITPFAEKAANIPLCVHGALRLISNHEGYRNLWEEQLGTEWREIKPKYSWPLLENDDDRWLVRSAIDAVVAQTYGLNRAQYQHILSTFSHSSYPKAPELCLSMFDELESLGLEAFCRKHDPYWDVPLNENLPQPAIQLPEVDYPVEGDGGPKRGRRSKKLMVKENRDQYTIFPGNK